VLNARFAILAGRRWRRVIVAAAIVIVVLAALALWGPVGLGNGPLSVWTASGGYGAPGAPGAPAVYVVPLTNSAAGTAVIDSVDVIFGPGYPTGHILSINVGRARGQCTALGSVSVLTGCVEPARKSAAGFAVPATPGTAGQHLSLVIELAGPAESQCEVIAKIVLHYHVGIRHYAGSYPQGVVSVCGPHARQPADS
jgi:hypothetical protein